MKAIINIEVAVNKVEVIKTPNHHCAYKPLIIAFSLVP